MTIRLPRALRRRRGFTAIELTAVATIIAIIALILIPIVRKRVDQTRLVAAADDMKTIETAQTLANADTGFYFRLCDLDNSAADDDTLDDPSSSGADREQALGEVPRAYWNEINTQIFGTTNGSASGTAIVQQWNGPYTTFNRSKFIPIPTIYDARPEIFRVVQAPSPPSTPSIGEGPILLIGDPGTRTGAPTGDSDFIASSTNNYPIDPWGNPYIFFGPGRINTETGGSPAITPANETNFGNAVVYSMGPDGEPGSLPGGVADANPDLYFRESAVLGDVNSDDLYRVF